MMFLVLGYLSESTIRHFCKCSEAENATFHVLDFAEIRSAERPEFEFDSHDLIIKLGNGSQYDFSNYDAFYFRMYGEPTLSTRDALLMHHTLSLIYAYLESCDQLVVNLPSSGASNANKFVHLKELADCAFKTPETHIIGNEVEAIRVLKHPSDWINKSISSVKTKADLLNSDFTRLNLLDRCPSYFQRKVDGFDVRLHVIGNKFFPLKIENETSEIDYRFVGGANKFGSISVPHEVQESCKRYCQKSRLEFCGFDFKVCDNVWTVLEANPMPGYDYFDRKLENRISKYLINYLSEGKPVNSRKHTSNEDAFVEKREG